MVKKYSELVDNLEKIKKKQIKAFENAEREAMEETLVFVKLYTPVLTGALRDSLKLRKYKETLTISSKLPYAKIVNDGSKNRKASLFMEKGFKEVEVRIYKYLKANGSFK